MRNIIGRFERQHEHLLPRRQFVARMVIFAALGIIIEAAAILIGCLGFHYIGGLNWLDGSLNAAMVITGNGPAVEPQTICAKIFQMIFSLSGVITFVLVVSVVLSPVLHRVLHHFHVAPDESAPNAKKE
jgi:hypothetical protein